ncbi:unnamed protein product [Closterium sp. Yama58-4]|nr:unnamed protein product [Closterium sp. Yama58-4]
MREYPTWGFHRRGYHVAGYHITGRQLAGISGDKPRQIGSTRVSVLNAADVAGESSETSHSAGDAADMAKGEEQEEPRMMSDPGSNPSGEIKMILGIETSCDDTGAAVVTSDGRILGEALASQGKVHAEWGGVVPSLARGEHEKAIDPVVQAALDEASLQPSDLSAVAVTIGPGLSLCLRVGVMKARRLAAQHGIPIIPIHHMEAHALVARLTNPDVAFPFLTLLISGGHNLLLLSHGVGQYTQLGTTLDDAMGEAFDKTARLLGLDLSGPGGGGAAVEALAREGNRERFKFSVPLARVKSCDFSFSGLKANVARCIQKEAPAAQTIPIAEATPEGWQLRADIAASFQEVAVLHLQSRVERAIQMARESTPAIDTLVMAGGVASNQVVRSRIAAVCEPAEVRLVCPPPRLCTDNGVMVAWAGYERFRLGIKEPPPAVDEMTDDAYVELRPRWPLADPPSSPSRSAKQKRLFPSLSSSSPSTPLLTSSSTPNTSPSSHLSSSSPNPHAAITTVT